MYYLLQKREDLDTALELDDRQEEEAEELQAFLNKFDLEQQ